MHHPCCTEYAHLPPARRRAGDLAYERMCRCRETSLSRRQHRELTLSDGDWD